MSEIVIKVENLSKKYLIGHQSEGVANLRDALTDGARNFARRLLHPFNSSTNQDSTEEFFALKDVSFEIKQGETGRHHRPQRGRQVDPAEDPRRGSPNRPPGGSRIDGRVASLLEVGTGFHPELTGRENVFLNGAILGMSRAEIRRKFDEIVAFSEVERFLDTPVKRYSSGMYVRLAFAVAAHLEPEILIVDEVLAVGDAQFQKKCLGKMEEVGREGRTVLFVSHNMAAVQNLCTRAILLKQGGKIADAATNDVIEKYLSDVSIQAKTRLDERTDRQGTGAVKFTSVQLLNEKNETANSLISGQFVKIILEVDRSDRDAVANATFAMGIDDQSGNRITVLTSEAGGGPLTMSPATNHVEIVIPKLPFVKGKYTYTLFCSASGTILDWVQNAGYFLVEAGDYYGTGKVPPEVQGSFLVDYSFRV